MPRIELSRLEDFATIVLQNAGMSAEHASAVATVMCAADRIGLGSHGVARLSTYLERVRAGVMEVDPEMVVTEVTAALATVDAANGFGQVAATRAMDVAMDKARRMGIAAVSVKNSNHFGIAGHYARTAAENRLIGIVMTNASPALPPFNAKNKLLGTNPVAIGIPSINQPMAVLDMSSTIVARGKIRRYLEEGRTTLPHGWANDAQGRPTTDPHEALEGSLAPIGGPKGAGLALMIDLLTGVLSGTSITGEVGNLLDASKTANTAHLMIVVDPDKFVGATAFGELVDTVLAAISSMEPADGGRVYYPGLIEHDRARDTAENGADITDEGLDRLNREAAVYGLRPLG